MKSKITAIILMLVMVLSTLTTTVFASEANTQSAPATPANFNTYSAYESVVLEWQKVDGAEYYVVNIDGKDVTVKDAKAALDGGNMLMYQDKTANDEGTHKYKVAAVNKSGKSAYTAVKSDNMVNTMKIRIKFKKNRKLKSHDKYKKKHTFKKGYTAKADGYAGGRYFFWYKEGNRKYRYYVNYLSVGNYKALYDKKNNYSNKEAEYFVNTSGQKSLSKETMIWVSLYTQHVYVFRKNSKTNKVWRLNTDLKRKGKAPSNWECSSGKATTPSPWGINLKYKGKQTNLFRKQKFNPGHGANYWNYFHSQAALHGPAGSQGYGSPYSHGCVRNPADKALFILEKVPKKTRIIMY